MKHVFKQLLKYYLKFITKLVLMIHKPVIIGIAGSVNKPFVKEEIKNALFKERIAARVNPKNFNTEIGLPLAVLYLPSGYNSYKAWLPILLSAPSRIMQKNFPKYLVLGLGTSDPGDMKYLLSIVKPDIGIVTDINQRYLESFSDMDQLVKEYEAFARHIKAQGALILNFDNNRVKSLASQSRAEIISFSIDNNSDYQANNLKTQISGINFVISHNGENKDVSLNKYGRHHVYSNLVAEIIKNYVVRRKTQIQ